MSKSNIKQDTNLYIIPSKNIIKYHKKIGKNYNEINFVMNSKI